MAVAASRRRETTTRETTRRTPPAPNNPTPGTPTFDLPIGDVATVELPDLAVIFRDFLNSVNFPLPDVQMSQLPQVAGSSF